MIEKPLERCLLGSVKNMLIFAAQLGNFQSLLSPDIYENQLLKI